MGIFDDGSATIIDAAANPVDRPPAGFMEGFSASYDTTRQEDLRISERQNTPRSKTTRTFSKRSSRTQSGCARSQRSLRATARLPARLAASPAPWLPLLPIRLLLDDTLRRFDIDRHSQNSVSIEQAGALRGEYEALFESGACTVGAVKRQAGRSPDELAQLAHESCFIDEADPALLKEALERDLSGEKIHSTHGDFFEREMGLEIEREFQRWAEAERTAILPN